MLQNILKNFPEQFNWQPEIKNGANLRLGENIILAGMGGSALTAGIISICLPQLSLIIHRDYGLPLLSSAKLKKSLIIASSYSGNTAETLDAFRIALNQNLSLAAIASGGELLELAKKHNCPYIELPQNNIEPRFVLGYSLLALLKILDQPQALKEAFLLSGLLYLSDAQTKGQALAEKLQNRIPVIYSSAINQPLSYVWKIKFNETAKIPAFINVLPELNHNEMTGFDTQGQTKELTQKFHFIFLQDETDHPQIIKRMDLLKNILERQEFKVEVAPLRGETILHKIFDSILIADWTSFYLAEFYGNDPMATPLVEEFKKLMSR